MRVHRVEDRPGFAGVMSSDMDILMSVMKLFITGEAVPSLDTGGGNTNAAVDTFFGCVDDIYAVDFEIVFHISFPFF